MRRRTASAVPASARIAAAARGAAVVAEASGWVWPLWLERRLGASSQTATTGPLGLLVNDAGRRWTALGLLDGPGVARVDPAGLVTPAGATWSLDWWIGGDDRWHLPSRDATLRQQAPSPGLVETSMRVPGGDAVQRVYAVLLPAADGGTAVLVVEVENRSAVPFALALSVRPVTTEGIGRIHDVAVDESGVMVDDDRALLLTQRPQRAAASTLATGDAAGIVFAGAATDHVEPRHDPAGMAHATVLVGVAHWATVRAVLPLTWDGDSRQRHRSTRARSRGSKSNRSVRNDRFPVGLPSAANVAAGWRTQLERGARLVLPDAALQRARDAALHRLLVAATADGAFDDLREVDGPLGLATVIEALAGNGFSAEAGALVAAWFDHLEPGRSASGREMDGSDDALALVSLARHWILSRDETLLAGTAAGVLDATRRLLAAASDPMWTVTGLQAAAELLAVGGSDAALDAVTRALADDARTGSDATSVARRDAAPLVRAAALRPSVTTPQRLAQAVQLVWGSRADLADGLAAPVPAPGGGGDPALGFAAVCVALTGGDADALAHLRRLVDSAGPNGTWPRRVHPRSGDGCVGSGDDPIVAASALVALRSVAVAERADGLDLCPAFGSGWYGSDVEAHAVPTSHGPLSFALRWHGARPALLWELDAPAGEAESEAAVLLRIPGLDPEWSSTQRRGDTLLAVPAVQAEPTR